MLANFSKRLDFAPILLRFASLDSSPFSGKGKVISSKRVLDETASQPLGGPMRVQALPLSSLRRALPCSLPCRKATSQALQGNAARHARSVIRERDI